MTNFHYPLPESEPTSPWSGLSDEARTALTRVAMGPSAANLLLQPDGQAVAELNPAFRDLVTNTHKQLGDLLADTNSGIIVPELNSPELNHVNWQRLQEGYDAYERLDLLPELVITVEGQPLSFWQGLYSGLRQWQDVNHPDSSQRLLKKNDGDGLFVHADNVNNWDKIIMTDHPTWSAVIIPTTLKAPVLNVDFQGNDKNDTTPNELADILGTIPDPINSDPAILQHPSPEVYLAFQASQIHRDEQPIDDKVNSLYYYTWLEGNFQVKRDNQTYTVAPRGNFYSGGGRVYLVWYKVGDRSGRLGVRPEVRG